MRFWCEFFETGAPLYRLQAKDGSSHTKGGHVNFGFLLCGVDPKEPPTRCFDLDSVSDFNVRP